MARLFPKRITNCRQCGWSDASYFQDVRGYQFLCFNPDMPDDIGFGTQHFNRRPFPDHDRRDFPKIRESHLSSVGNIRIPDECPLEQTE